MSISIPSELEEFVRSAIASGSFRNENEVLAEALRLLRQREQLRSEVNAGVEQLDEGKGIPGEQVFERLQKKAQAISRPTTANP